jgi:hypothetical protein
MVVNNKAKNQIERDEQVLQLLEMIEKLTENNNTPHFEDAKTKAGTLVMEERINNKMAQLA